MGSFVGAIAQNYAVTKLEAAHSFDLFLLLPCMVTLHLIFLHMTISNFPVFNLIL